jgi:hypothetical protein
MSETENGNSIARRLPVILLVLGLSILLIWVGLVAYRAYSLYGTLDQMQAEAQILSNDGITGLNINRIEELTLDARQDFIALNNSTKPLYGILPYLSWIPEIGPLLAATPHLMQMADAGSYAAVEMLDGMKPAVILLQNSGGSNTQLIGQMLEILESAEPNTQNALKALEYLSNSRDEIGDTSQLPWRVQTLLEIFDNELPLLENGLKLSTVLPQIMGTNGRRSYLIMAQNEDEIRPTGGFISGAGLLVVEDGQIVSVEFSDANYIDDYLNKPYDFPPTPFYEIMGMDIFLFRDSNFWPDFPQSAEMVMDLYTRGQDIPVDGVIAINQEFIKELLSAVGPLFVPELERTLSSNNVISEMRNQWGPTPGQEIDWVNERKAFMGPMANALRQRLEADFSSIDELSLIRSLGDAADRRDLQIYMRDPAVADVLADTGWDGQFQNSSGQDYLLVVDTSLGFNKVSAIIDKELSYHVSIPEEGDPTADLLIEYSHGGEQSEEACFHGTYYTIDIAYSDLFNDCYWNYVRVYAPLGSELIGSSLNPVAAEHLLSGQPWEGSARIADESSEKFQVFDSFYLVGQGEQVAGEINYSLPQAVIQSSDVGHVYRLEVAKQAGISPYPFSVWVTLPSGAEFVSATPQPTHIDNYDIVFTEILSSDMVFEVTYR